VSGDAPRLRAADIRSQLRALSRLAQHPRPVALHGCGERGQVELEGHAWQVEPVRCELELRAALMQAGSNPALVLLVDSTDPLPLDVACRLAGQRVHVIDRRKRLAHMFGARGTAPGVVHTVLARVLLEELPAGLLPIGGTVLQLEDAWRRYLALHLRLPAERKLDLGSLLSSTLEQPEAGPAFRLRRDDARWGRLLQEAEEYVTHGLGPAGLPLWRAWLAGGVEDLLAWLVHIDAARRAEHPGSQVVLRSALRYAPGVEPTLLDEPVAGPLCDALDGCLESLSEEPRRRILQRAAALFDDPDFAAARRASPWLPEGLEALEDELAKVLEPACQGGNALDLAIGLAERIGQHRLVGIDDTAKRRDAVRLAGVRLATWLAWLRRRPLPDSPGWTGLAALVRWYDAEGGWADWARDELRSHTTGNTRLDAALQPVLARADTQRRQLDQQFAEALVAWHQADKPASDVLPIEDVARRVVAPFLREHPTRRLLVLVLDGMSVSVATRLLDGLDEWAPLAWAPPQSATVPPALAALPSTSATSRAALFAGRCLPRHGDESEGLDPQRWAENDAVFQFAGTDAGPRLFLKGTIQRGSDLHPELARVLADEQERAVAVVLNAVDAELWGSDQVAVDYDRPQSIPLLERLLRAARDSQRAVLLASDHGHVPAQAISGQPLPDGAQGGHRYRTLGPGQAPQEGEVPLPEGCWKPKRSRAVALLWDERRCWGRGGVGVHGGASMAEVVVPLRMMAPRWRQDDLPTVDPHVPAWWRLLRPAPVRRKAPAAPRQLTLPVQPTPAPTPAAVPTVASEEGHPLTRALAESSLFKAQARDQSHTAVKRALQFVDALLQAEGNQLAAATFANRVGVPARRVTGLIAHAGFLNADGYAIVESDPVSRQVRLHLGRMLAQYGLEGPDDR